MYVWGEGGFWCYQTKKKKKEKKKRNTKTQQLYMITFRQRASVQHPLVCTLGRHGCIPRSSFIPACIFGGGKASTGGQGLGLQFDLSSMTNPEIRIGARMPMNAIKSEIQVRCCCCQAEAEDRHWSILMLSSGYLHSTPYVSQPPSLGFFRAPNSPRPVFFALQIRRKRLGSCVFCTSTHG